LLEPGQREQAWAMSAVQPRVSFCQCICSQAFSGRWRPTPHRHSHSSSHSNFSHATKSTPLRHCTSFYLHSDVSMGRAIPSKQLTEMAGQASCRASKRACQILVGAALAICHLLCNYPLLTTARVRWGFADGCSQTSPASRKVCQGLGNNV